MVVAFIILSIYRNKLREMQRLSFIFYFVIHIHINLYIYIYALTYARIYVFYIYEDDICDQILNFCCSELYKSQA